MQIEAFSINGPLVVRPERFSDERGWFCESWSQRALRQAGLDVDFVQDNISISHKAGTLRGLHCQTSPFAQGKLIWVITGAVLDVAVDVRSESPTYGHHVSLRLTEEDPAQIWIPPGFLHGLITLRPDTRVLYKATAPYSPNHDRAVAWNDPDLAVDWGEDAPILSPKDAKARPLREQDDLFCEQPVDKKG